MFPWIVITVNTRTFPFNSPRRQYQSYSAHALLPSGEIALRSHCISSDPVFFLLRIIPETVDPLDVACTTNLDCERVANAQCSFGLTTAAGSPSLWLPSSSSSATSGTCFCPPEFPVVHRKLLRCLASKSIEHSHHLYTLQYSTYIHFRQNTLYYIHLWIKTSSMIFKRPPKSQKLIFWS
jgi:hypothetical protein